MRRLLAEPRGMICPVPRRVFSLCSAVSLLLCAAVGALWMGSRTTPGTIALRTTSSYADGPALKFIEADSHSGHVELCLYSETNPSTIDPNTYRSRPYTPAERAAYRAANEPVFAAVSRFRRWPLRRPAVPPRWDVPLLSPHGMRYIAHWEDSRPDGSPHYRSNDSNFPGIYRLRYLTLAYWPWCLLFSALPALWLHRTLRYTRRRNAGCCPTCGYDLRASPDHCPECGEAVGQRVPAAE